MHIVLETPRLLLRQFTLLDAPLLRELHSNPAVMKYLHERPIDTDEKAATLITDVIMPQYQNGLGRWAMHLKANNEFIGWCGLKQISPAGDIDLGYRLQQKYWGKGFATEAAKQTLDYGFQKLQLKQIVGKAHANNAASISILQKIGMQFVTDAEEDNCPIKIFLATKPLS